MRGGSRRILATFAGVAALCCGGTTDVGRHDGGAGTGGRDAGTGGGSTGGAGGSACPGTPPADGSPCPPGLAGPVTSPTSTSAHCSWGADPRPGCRTTALCDGSGRWQVTTPGQDCSAPPLPAACPTLAGATGPCTDSTLTCWYGDGSRCTCSPCLGGSPYPVCQTMDPPAWACSPVRAGCPARAPDAGSPCTTEGASCGPDCSLLIVCQGGVWTWQRDMCPICAAPETPIATPDGERPIASLHVGDLVLSLEGGAVVAVPVALAGSTPVSRHGVTRVTLETGRTLEVSPGHPLADGTHFADLAPGTRLGVEGPLVRAVELVPYRHDRTYDILPASSTGTYRVAGAWVRSTLRGSSSTGAPGARVSR